MVQLNSKTYSFKKYNSLCSFIYLKYRKIYFTICSSFSYIWFGTELMSNKKYPSKKLNIMHYYCLYNMFYVFFGNLSGESSVDIERSLFAVRYLYAELSSIELVWFFNWMGQTLTCQGHRGYRKSFVNNVT